MLSPEQKKELREKIDAYQHLPREMRDFHAQKDVFKSFIEWFKGCLAKQRKERGSPEFFLDELDQYTWTGIQVFMMDYFLHWMALHGYRLSKWNPKCETYDLDNTIAARRTKELEQLKYIFAEGDKNESK